MKQQGYKSFRLMIDQRQKHDKIIMNKNKLLNNLSPHPGKKQLNLNTFSLMNELNWSLPHYANQKAVNRGGEINGKLIGQIKCLNKSIQWQRKQ
jgi:hypothetical protein